MSIKETSDWGKLGFTAAAEQVELRTKLYRMTVEDLFAKEQLPLKAAAEWMGKIAGSHKFNFVNTSTATKEELTIFIQEAIELLGVRDTGK